MSTVEYIPFQFNVQYLSFRCVHAVRGLNFEIIQAFNTLTMTENVSLKDGIKYLLKHYLIYLFND